MGRSLSDGAILNTIQELLNLNALLIPKRLLSEIPPTRRKSYITCGTCVKGITCGGPSIAMMCHLRRVSDLLCNWKSCLLCYMKNVVLHCSIFFKWNKLVRVRVRVWNLHEGFGLLMVSNSFVQHVAWEMFSPSWFESFISILSHAKCVNNQGTKLNGINLPKYGSMVTKYFFSHSQNERQGLCTQNISLSVDDKAYMRPVIGSVFVSQLCLCVLP